MTKRKLLLTCALALAACDTDAVDLQADDADDSFLGGPKADGALIAEGTPEAFGVLALVNEASHAVLDDDVALDARAASNIVEHRDIPGADLESRSERKDARRSAPEPTWVRRAHVGDSPSLLGAPRWRMGGAGS